MVAQHAGPAGRSRIVGLDNKAPKPRKDSGRRGWRASRDRERLGPAVWVGGILLVAVMFGLLSALFGAG
ncbi:hypothetical protein AiwAL_15805 [Acidiphilium sp. AL]|uniref:Uncharacterized protein n=1 Tax=Acidiphilium iwatense TaxID=768198 RepID=A0ABS9DZE9_9PROT|nr:MULTISPECIES: hypothetical protein [Acidiphilium]MCF3948141.1 hypothetical protein [Acidiphilium iwatense]MCU4161550.1 hypothetical protein [Acidiphilium sp. AL]